MGLVIYSYDRNQEMSETRDKNTQRECIFDLPWTLSRMCCWASPAALVARQVYLPESSSLASVTFSILPADSSCGRYKSKHTQNTETVNYTKVCSACRKNLSVCESGRETFCSGYKVTGSILKTAKYFHVSQRHIKELTVDGKRLYS